MVIILIILVVVVFILFYGDDPAVKAAKRAKLRSKDQLNAMRYFLNDGCLKKKVADSTYDQLVQDKINSLNLKQRAIQCIGMDESQMQEIAPVCVQNYIAEDAYVKQGKDDKVRTSRYQVSWIFFSENQVYLYQNSFNLDSDDSVESTSEYFYKDITCFDTQNKVEERIQGSKDSKKKLFKGGVKLKKILVKTIQFVVIVPGANLYCSAKMDDATMRTINGMKSKLREKKNA